MLNDVVKKNGTIILKPKLKGSDSFICRADTNKPIYFRIRLLESVNSMISIKFDLRCATETNIKIKQASTLDQDKEAEVPHLEIPFSVSLSTQSEKPCDGHDETHSFPDSNSVAYKVPKHSHDKYLYVAFKAIRDCIMHVKVSKSSKNTFKYRGQEVRMRESTNSLNEMRKINLSLSLSKKELEVEQLHK